MKILVLILFSLALSIMETLSRDIIKSVKRFRRKKGGENISEK